jgi:hypothetical protein
VYVTGLGSCSVAYFVGSDVEPSCYAFSELVN